PSPRIIYWMGGWKLGEICRRVAGYAAARREPGVNAYEQLVAIRDQLEQNGASEESVALVEKFLNRAESERTSQVAVSQVMMLRHLLRQREAIDNYGVYNDLQEVMSHYEERRTRDEDVRPAYEEEHKPRPHSYYKALREREKEKK